MRKPIYLDYNGTTPLDRRVADAMLPYLFEHFGNPSSSHVYGERCRQAIERAREQLASLIHAETDEILFTSGGTESNNMVIHGVAQTQRARGHHIVISAFEHVAIEAPCAYLEQQGFQVTRVPVDQQGLVDLKALEAALTSETILVSVMHANNEVGTIQPIAQIAALARRCGALVHTDAAQSVGKVDVNVRAMDVDFLTVGGHKLYAPKGVGALFIRRGLSLPALMQGAPQEHGRRPGTENVLEIVGLGKAAEICQMEHPEELHRLERLRDLLWEKLVEVLGDRVKLNGHPEQRLPNTLNLSFRGVDAPTLIAAIADEVVASAGAACHSDTVEPSAVLMAMHVPTEEARCSLRLSVGRMTLRVEVERTAEVIAERYLALLPAS